MKKTSMQLKQKPPLIRAVSTDQDILKCWDVLRLLRPHLRKRSFVPTVREMLGEGYRLVYIQKEDRAVSAAGFRYIQNLFQGKHLYIDDLSTLAEHRGYGYGALLLDHISALARAEGYRFVTLDSGFGRHDAHRLYLNRGYRIASLHFAQEL